MSESRERTDQAPFRILVVDDNKDAADTLATLLRLWGLEVRVVYDGAQAIEAANAYLPDCILTDIGLPGIDGYVLAERVRQTDALRMTILIAITAYSDVGKAKAAGFDHHLVKPADPVVLEKLVMELRAIGKQLERAEEIVEKQGGRPARPFSHLAQHRERN
jgi:CheY-like chemotaxis protein